ncbi:class I SAM-dependent methyltransferase [Humisphaera borealis]|uniref:Methyltransferase domain-containing protein n=1 Tax=Humisphaera borealis TaxID=2807512 RepID=A0A7M2X236_9BACT|nr:methyltransferase domain-containing protein [Humisphaera borealis]QOV91836.1 methyltransferase domain-containing protein [Humisphaera borealis]
MHGTTTPDIETSRGIQIEPAVQIKPAPPFLFRFLADFKQVASIAPSSRWLAAATCRHVSSDRPQTILELGAGTGAITAAACRKMHPQSRLIAIEIDAGFADHLAVRCPRAEVVRGDVRHLDAELDRLGVGNLDLVLNGLPTPSLPAAVNQAVFETLGRRASSAWISQLTVMPWVYKPMYHRLFQDVIFDLVPLNIPPGGVYHCRSLKHDWAEQLPGIRKIFGRRKSA